MVLLLSPQHVLQFPCSMLDEEYQYNMSFMSSCVTMAESLCHVCPQSNHVKDI